MSTIEVNGIFQQGKIILMSKKTLVLGASTNPTRYSNIAAKRLAQHQYKTVLLGRSEGEIAGSILMERED